MPEIINCPQCDRQLRVPDDLLGHTVKCPSCGVIFQAPVAAVESAPAPFAGAAGQAPLEIYQDEDAGRPGALRIPERLPGREDEGVPRPSYRPRADLLPHHGTLILVLGILSIVICGFLGPVAWIMGSNDLKEIRAGRMDPEGQGTTNGGRICGIIGTVLNLVLPVCCGIPLALIWLLSLRTAVQQGF